MSAYKVSLDPKVLSRARLILGSLLGLVTLFIVAGIYQGVQTGDFDRLLVKPFRDFGTEFEKAVNAAPVPAPSLTIELTSPSPSQSPLSSGSVKQNRIYNIQGSQGQQKVQPTPSPYKTYEQLKQEQDVWWAQVQKQNAELSQKSKQELEQFRQQSQQNLKNFEQQGQTGLEQFRQESQQKMEEFRQKYGIQ